MEQIHCLLLPTIVLMKRTIKILLVILAICTLIIALFISLFGIYIPYNLRIDKGNSKFRVEKIDLRNHKTQNNDDVYSISTSELKELINSSDSTYQLLFFYNLTCPSVKHIANLLSDTLVKLGLVESFLICVSDRTLCPLLIDFLKEKDTKKYIIDSKLYYSNFFDIYEHNNNAKLNFLNEIRKNKFYDGTYVILFKRWDNILFFDGAQYYKKYWKEGMNSKLTTDLFIETLLKDIAGITKYIAKIKKIFPIFLTVPTVLMLRQSEFTEFE